MGARKQAQHIRSGIIGDVVGLLLEAMRNEALDTLTVTPGEYGEPFHIALSFGFVEVESEDDEDDEVKVKRKVAAD